MSGLLPLSKPQITSLLRRGSVVVEHEHRRRRWRHHAIRARMPFELQFWGHVLGTQVLALPSRHQLEIAPFLDVDRLQPARGGGVLTYSKSPTLPTSKRIFAREALHRTRRECCRRQGSDRGEASSAARYTLDDGSEWFPAGYFDLLDRSDGVEHLHDEFRKRSWPQAGQGRTSRAAGPATWPASSSGACSTRVPKT